jgi:hypothetical protein
MRTAARFIGVAAIVAATASCGDVVREGRAPVYLVIDTLAGSTGNPVLSDVQTLATSPAPCSTTSPCPTIINDVGQVTFRVVLKDIGTPGSPAQPTSNNDVTISRYRVTYRRADGRNTPGVDVPYPFDGALTGTVPAGGSASLSFNLVRNVAKVESPLAQLVNSFTILSTFTEVTFYGRDRVGNDISVTGTIQIEFGNFGDS